MTTITLPQPTERKLFLAKQVDQASINELSKAIIEINEDDIFLQRIYAAHDLNYEPKPIKIYIDSYGGYVYQCLGLLSIMETSKIPVHTIVTGCAMSCGFLISITGHKRYGHQKSTYLYHQVSSWAAGTIKDMEEKVVETSRLQKIIEDHTVARTHITAKKLEKVYKTKRDWYIDSEEALKLGIIDEVI